MERFNEIIGMSFDEFYNSNKDRLINYINNINRNYDTEGIVDIAFTKLYNNIESFNPDKASINTYLFTIARNELFVTIKNEKIKIEYKEYDDFTQEETLDFLYTDATRSNLRGLYEEYDESVDEKFEALKNDMVEYGDICVEIWFSGKSYKEISEETGININTCKSKVNYFKRFMCKKYGVKYTKYNTRGKLEINELRHYKRIFMRKK